jgi:DeoR/GlpR family transcriptional regulator of sugar metabolism
VDTAHRRDSIREVVDREGQVRLSELSQEFGVAPVTIHRDLEYLAAEGMIQRVRGGARSSTGTQVIRSEYAIRRDQNLSQKNEIAERALQEIPDGATLFLDSSTTVFALAKVLEREPNRGLTVVTNSPAIANDVVAPFIHIIVLPGELNQPLRAITGRWAAEFMESLSFTVAFVSAAGITPNGLTTTQRELAEVTRAVFDRATRRIALVDSTKFGTKALISMASVDRLDLVITDPALPAEDVEDYRRAGMLIAQ